MNTIMSSTEMSSNAMSSTEIMAHDIIYELWYSVAETIFQRVCSITELDEEQIDALRKAALRPNDFQIQVL